MIDRLVHHAEVVALKGDSYRHNRPENLELWSRWQPRGQRVEDKVAWAKEPLRRYEPNALVDHSS